MYIRTLGRRLGVSVVIKGLAHSATAPGFSGLVSNASLTFLPAYEERSRFASSQASGSVIVFEYSSLEPSTTTRNFTELFFSVIPIPRCTRASFGTGTSKVTVDGECT